MGEVEQAIIASVAVWVAVDVWSTHLVIKCIRDLRADVDCAARMIDALSVRVSK